MQESARIRASELKERYQGVNPVPCEKGIRGIRALVQFQESLAEIWYPVPYAQTSLYPIIDQ
jgi:hypothetical protein